MKKLLIIFIFFFQFAFSQNESEKNITLSFNNSSKIDALKQIEKITDYRFYFVEDWLDNTLISGNYKNVSIKELLDNIFKNTIINYFISSDNKIILSQSVLITNTLPIGYFGEANEKITTTEQKISSSKKV